MKVTRPRYERSDSCGNPATDRGDDMEIKGLNDEGYIIYSSLDNEE